MGSVEARSGVQLMAIDLDSTTYDMGVNFGSPALLDNMSSFTFLAWIKPAGWGESNLGRIAQKSAGAGSGYGWIIFLNDVSTDESITFLRYRSFVDTTVKGANFSIDLNEWQHIAVTYQSTGTEIYKNAVELSYSSYTAGSGTNSSDSSEDFIVGNQDSSGRGFDGLIEDVRVYDRVLSADEISQIYASLGRDGIWQGRVLHAPLTQWAPGATIGSGSGAVKDITANKLNGTSLYSSTTGAEGLMRG
jgi:hypothetical protein